MDLMSGYDVNFIRKRHSKQALERNYQGQSDPDSMIDSHGFNQGLGIILVNSKRQLFIAKRLGKDAWQFPQAD